MANGSEIASLNVNNKKILFKGNFRFNIDDGNRKTNSAFEGTYEVRDGQVYKDGKAVENLNNLPEALAEQLIGMSNVGWGEKEQNIFTEVDLKTIKSDYNGGVNGYTDGKSGNGWIRNDAIDNRVRRNVGNKNVTGYYNEKDGGFKTVSNSGSVSIWMQ